MVWPVPDGVEVSWSCFLTFGKALGGMGAHKKMTTQTIRNLTRVVKGDILVLHRVPQTHLYVFGPRTHPPRASLFAQAQPFLPLS